jgi:hypothetical protein
VDTTASAVAPQPAPRQVGESGQLLVATSDGFDTLVLRLADRPGRYVVTLYNLMGQELVKRTTEFKSFGHYSVASWPLPDLATGMYIASIEIGAGRLSAKFVLQH